jgi:hypothetical protein
MTELEDAMRVHMSVIVHKERRPFCYKDFKYFKVNEKLYSISHGTFRNKISEMIQNGEVEVSIKSNPNFYTLKGYRFDKKTLMTSNHTEANNISTQKLIHHSLYQIIEGTPFGERAVHDLHLTFNAQGIYNTLLNNQELKKEINPHNKGIRFPYTNINIFTIIITVYPTDTCQIVIGCSENPILLNFEGVNKFTTTLCRIEERLSYLCSGSSIKIPNYKYWIITLWHIGKDSISEYSKEMFHCEWNLTEQIILRIYSKTIERKNKIRIEIQQNPSISIDELKKAIIEKILK